MSRQDAMLEAHVQFELKRLKGKHLRRTIEEEVGSLLEWLEGVKINAVFTPVQVQDLIQRRVISMPLADELVDYIRDNVVAVHALLQRDGTTVEQFLPRDVFDQSVEILIGLENLRRRVTHQLVSSSVYSMLIANVLYQGIKAYVLTENVLAKNIPGASSLMRLGKRSLNAASPKLEGNIDRQLIKFINANIQETITESERFLDKALTPALMRKLGDEVWATNSDEKIGELTGDVNATSLDAIVDAIQDFWLHYRTTPLFADLVARLVDKFFTRYGDQDIRSFLTNMGISQAMITQDACAFAIPLVQQGLKSGYLERRLRSRLGAFYAQYESE